VLPALIALAGAAAAVVAAVLFGVVSARRARRLEERTRYAFGEVAAVLQRLAGELAEAHDRFERDRTIEESLSSLLATADVGELMQWTAQTAAELCGASASIVQAPADPDGVPGLAAHGLSAADGLNRLVVWPPDGPRAIAFTFEYAPGTEAPVRFRSGLAVPLQQDAADSFVAVFTADDEPPGEEAVAALEALAALAAPAIARLRRAERREPGRDDALTGLGARRVFHDTLAREVAQAQWHETPLALLVLDVDDFGSVNQRVGLVGGDHVLAEVARRLVGAARSTDATSCRIGADEFGVILPNATVIDAESVFAGVQASLRHTPPEELPGLALSAGVAELGADDDPIGVFERAHLALRDAKQGGKGTAVVATAIRLQPRA
jgi:diguanylate cyclase (GGDEF)-like protein